MSQSEREVMKYVDAEILNATPEFLQLIQKCDLENHIVEMKRIFKPMGKPQFKGKGFYETDYKKK